MTIKEVDGIIYTRQGDTGYINISGFNPDINYNVYLQIYDEDGNFIGDQLEAQSNTSDTVRFFIPASVTDSLEVPAGEQYQIYYIGVKKAEVDTSYEDTVIPGFGEQKIMIVYRKVAEGPSD